MLISVLINEKLYYFNDEVSILDACTAAGIKLPRFCYHESLSIAGNCRMCIVEIEKLFKPIVACSMDISNNMTIYTNSPMVLKSRENILEFLLLNHPLDCPICDQGGECDLQDQALFYGSFYSRNYFLKRGVEDKNCGSLIKMIMNRCIHCTRCIRFGEEVCGVKFLSSLKRGVSTEIGNYILKLNISELSANVVDLCPVGALTFKYLPFQTRAWELESLESIDLSDGLGCNVYFLYKNLDIFKVVPKKNKIINDFWLSNKGRYYYNCFFNLFTNIYQYFKTNSSDINFSKKTLILLNGDLDLRTLTVLKKNIRKNFKVKVLNSTRLNTNYFFWGIKSKLDTFYKLDSGLVFMVGVCLEREASLLNARIRTTLLQRFSVRFATFGASFVSTFPYLIYQFCNQVIIDFFFGKILESRFLVSDSVLFFTNKLFLNRFDFYFLKVLHYFIENNIMYNILFFCNSESLNILNIQKFNLKEYLFSEQIFGCSLDDSFFLRKLLAINSKFFWINQFPTLLFSFFNNIVWLFIQINQIAGLYLNMEQRTQKMSLPKTQNHYTYKSLFYMLSKIQNSKTFFLKKVLNLAQLDITIKNFFYQYHYILESAQFSEFFDQEVCDFYAYKDLFIFNFFFYYKQYPFRSIIEDPYRTSINLKYSLPLFRCSAEIRQFTSILC